MSLQKLQFKQGIVRNTTSLASEGGWRACDKIRFRGGFPEKIGGWQRISAGVYLGVCRALAVWRIQAQLILTGVGTHLKVYIESGGAYADVTPLRASKTVATNAFTTVNGSSVVTVNDTAHGASTGDFVTVSGAATAVGGIAAASFNGNFQVTVLTGNTYQITLAVAATGAATGGNATVDYEVGTGSATDSNSTGAWGEGGFGSNVWGTAGGVVPMRTWTLVPYGQNLVCGPRYGALYQWAPDAAPASRPRAVPITSLAGASSVPLFQFHMLLEQSARILVAFGTNGYGTITNNPLLVRWSDAGSVAEWAPSVLTQAGEYTLAMGSTIVAAANLRADILVWTDAALYTMQYVNQPYIFNFALQANNISIIGPSAVAAANGIAYWMGTDKFYMYNGRSQPLPCPLSDEVFNDINLTQGYQTVAGTNEGFDEVWWFYCSANATSPDRYAVFNYAENIWYYGSMNRTAWLDSALKEGPLAATALQNLVVHEIGTDDLSTGASVGIAAFAESNDFDIGDGNSLGFVRRILPDVTFVGSTATAPTVQMTVRTRNNPGAAHNAEVANDVTRMSTVDVEQWTEQAFIRARGRQMSLRVASNAVGVQWKIGTPRIDVRPDGRAA